MSNFDIEITHPHQLSLEETRSRAEAFVESVKNQFNLTWNWEENTIYFEVKSGLAKGLTGIVRLNEGSVFVGAKLPFMLKAMKGMAEQQLRSELAQVIDS